jgi:hypothetical protein
VEFDVVLGIISLDLPHHLQLDLKRIFTFLSIHFLAHIFKTIINFV